MKLALAIVLAACSKTPPMPDIEVACQSDGDCELTLGLDCCSACTPTAVNRATAAAIQDRCRTIAADEKDYFARCPHLSCTCQKAIAKCIANTCTADIRPCGAQ